METNRRNWLKLAGTLPVSGSVAVPLAAAGSTAAPPSAALPAREEFSALTRSRTYLNSASTHPMSASAAKAVADYAAAKAQGGGAVNSNAVRAKFARLINADPTEIAYVPSTSMGEYLVTAAMDLPNARGRIVTDALHFVGSFYLYEQLGQRGMDVVTLRLRNSGGAIDLEQFDAAITRDTRLVAISHVSFVNGFEHDMKAICDIAHSRGALVYADIIQSAGAVPVDVKAWGVDFAACGSYKWLMGDFGLAFLYARKDRLERLRRPWYGYLQTNNFANPITRLYPYDPSGEPAFQSAPRTDVQGYFNGSFPARAVEAALDHSLDWLLKTGVGNIQTYRQPMIDAIQQELRRRGFEPMTPSGSRSAIVSFAYQNAARLSERLNPAKVAITLSGNRFRISPSVFNDMNDVDRLLQALGTP